MPPGSSTISERSPGSADGAETSAANSRTGSRPIASRRRPPGRRRDDIASRVQALQHDQIAFERFEKTQGWRQDDMVRLRDRLDDHWAQTVAACVRADDPLAFGIDKLRHARATTAARIEQLDASLPPDRTSEWQDARAQLPQVLRARHHAERAFADSQASLDESSRRRWGRHDRDAIAAAQGRVAYNEQRLEEARTAERDLRDRLARIVDPSTGTSAGDHEQRPATPGVRYQRSRSWTPRSITPARNESTR